MKILRNLPGSLAPLTFLAALVAYWYPPVFLLFSNWFLWFFAATMFALGIVLEPSEFVLEVSSPKRLALGLMTQFTVMPLLGFSAAYWSGLDPDLALGFIIVGCAPGAMASNVIVFLSGGATAYSVALTTAATFLSPLLTPSLVEILGGVFLPVPFWPMMRTILATVLVPLLAGMVTRRFLGRGKDFATAAAPAIAVVAIVIIIGVAVASNADQILGVGLRIFTLVVLINLAGYLAGWAAGGIFRFDRRHRLALSIEIGMQNAGLGVALALAHFARGTALPGVLFAVWCILTATAISSYLGKRADPPSARAGRLVRRGNDASCQR